MLTVSTPPLSVRLTVGILVFRTFFLCTGIEGDRKAGSIRVVSEIRTDAPIRGRKFYTDGDWVG